MDNPLLSKVSIEQFAAYLDGNLSAEEMDSIEAIVASDDAFREMAELSDEIDEETQDYLKDDFSQISEMDELDYNEIEIPAIDLDDSISVLDIDDNESHLKEENQYDISHPNEIADLHLSGDINEFPDAVTHVDSPNLGLSSEAIIDEAIIDEFYTNELDEPSDDLLFDDSE